MRRILACGLAFLAAVVAASCAEGETLDPDTIHRGGAAGKLAHSGAGSTSNGVSGGSSSAGSSMENGVAGGNGGSAAGGGTGGGGTSGGNGGSAGGAGGTGGTSGQGGSSGAPGADGGPKDATAPASCDAGSSCVQCAEQKCPAMACAKCEDQNHVKCSAACEAMLACAIQHYPCGGANDGICFNQCNQIINAQPGGSPPRDWTNALIACGCK